MHWIRVTFGTRCRQRSLRFTHAWPGPAGWAAKCHSVTMFPRMTVLQTVLLPSAMPSTSLWLLLAACVAVALTQAQTADAEQSVTELWPNAYPTYVNGWYTVPDQK